MPTRVMLKLSCSLLMLVLCVGCGGADLPKLYETSGTATTGGQPMAKASIVMTPSAGGRPSYAEIDDQGNFKMLCTVEAQGATAGENIVTLTEPNPMPDAPPVTKEMKAIYEKYAEGASPMKIQIDANKTDWDLKFD